MTISTEGLKRFKLAMRKTPPHTARSRIPPLAKNQVLQNKLCHSLPFGDNSERGSGRNGSEARQTSRFASKTDSPPPRKRAVGFSQPMSKRRRSHTPSTGDRPTGARPSCGRCGIRRRRRDGSLRRRRRRSRPAWPPHAWCGTWRRRACRARCCREARAG